MKRRTLLLLPSLAVLCLGTGPCPQPQVISGLVSVPGYQQPQTPGSGLHSFCDLAAPACHLTSCSRQGFHARGRVGALMNG